MLYKAERERGALRLWGNGCCASDLHPRTSLNDLTKWRRSDRGTQDNGATWSGWGGGDSGIKGSTEGSCTNIKTRALNHCLLHSPIIFGVLYISYAAEEELCFSPVDRKHWHLHLKRIILWRRATQFPTTLTDSELLSFCCPFPCSVNYSVSNYLFNRIINETWRKPNVFFTLQSRMTSSPEKLNTLKISFSGFIYFLFCSNPWSFSCMLVYIQSRSSGTCLKRRISICSFLRRPSTKSLCAGVKPKARTALHLRPALWCPFCHEELTGQKRKKAEILLPLSVKGEAKICHILWMR